MSEVNHCPTCNAVIAPYMVQCPSCGTTLVHLQTPEQPNPPGVQTPAALPEQIPANSPNPSKWIPPVINSNSQSTPNQPPGIHAPPPSVQSQQPLQPSIHPSLNSAPQTPPRFASQLGTFQTARDPHHFPQSQGYSKRSKSTIVYIILGALALIGKFLLPVIFVLFAHYL